MNFTLYEGLLLEAVDAHEVSSVSPAPSVLTLLSGLLPAKSHLQDLVTHP